MNRKCILLFYCCFLITADFFVPVCAQNSTFLADNVNDFIRRNQLIGKVGITNSLLIQDFSKNYSAIDSLNQIWHSDNNKTHEYFTWLPISSTLQNSTHHPYNMNDGGMIPARGLQMSITGGIISNVGKFSIQIRPEIFYAQNLNFETFPHEHFDPYWNVYYQWLNTIDLPEQFKEGTYKKVLPGQSSIRWNNGSFSAGISTENMWWGPGRYYALILSNNAPGFLHLTLNTTKPIKTSIGSFEGQLIAGSLSSSGVTPPDTNRYLNGIRMYVPKKESDRYLSGLIVSWQPKWVKGLFIGFSAMNYLYQDELSGIADMLPIAGLIKSENEKNKKKSALGSLFARYIMPEEHAELYFEYGRKDKVPSIINVVTETCYPRAYVAGFRKLFTSNRKNRFIEFAGEFTQLQMPTGDLTLKGESWYTDPYVKQGYTNKGQLLGASIGPGSNSQLIDISYVKEYNKVGIKFERILRNNDFYYNAFIPTNNPYRHWVDISTTVHADWQVKRFLFSSHMSLIRSLNYQWANIIGLGYFKDGYDVLNFTANLSFSYRL